MLFISSIWEYLINFLEICLFFLFENMKLHRSLKIKHIFQKQCLFLFFQYSILCVLNHLALSSLLTVALSCILDLLFVLLFYQDSVLMRLFWGFMYSVICMIAEYITILIPQTFSNVTSSEVLLGGELRIPFTLLYIALITVLVFLFSYIGNKKIALSAFQKLSYLAISTIGLIIGHYILFITLESVEKFQDSSFTSSLILVNLFFILLFLSLLLYIYQLGYSTEQNKELLENQKLLELEELEYQNLLKSTASLREMKHDIEIHLDVIQTLAANQETDKLLSYIESYHHALELTHHMTATGNTAIDCILSAKIALAQKSGIQTDFSVMLPEYFPLDALTLSALLGNLWNNAIEANQRLVKETKACNPYIHFFIKPFQHMVIIHIENSYDGVLNLGNDHAFRSTKPGNGHGIGMKRIHDIVRAADGIIQIQTENHLFRVHILLPQKEPQDENKNHNT